MPHKAVLAMTRSGHVLLKMQENLRWGEVMSKGNVVSFTERKAEIQAGIEFLDLLDRDIKENPEGIQPISSRPAAANSSNSQSGRRQSSPRASRRLSVE
ncbi:hypothetical protein [Pseudomonas sp. RL_5y_Pfl2_73]|uniref:hypothetical protein n=1 Tax=Pseudomonas sp. RL_5y_Pfl2_73 TaxID=3088713 RepID=UPI0030DC4815